MKPDDDDDDDDENKDYAKRKKPAAITNSFERTQRKIWRALDAFYRKTSVDGTSTAGFIGERRKRTQQQTEKLIDNFTGRSASKRSRETKSTNQRRKRWRDERYRAVLHDLTCNRNMRKHSPSAGRGNR